MTDPIKEALESARAHILDAYRIWQADDVSAVPPPLSGAGSVIAKIDAILSSPGKDGGQEVEAAEWQGRYWIEDEGRWSNWITNPVGYPWAYDLQEGKSEIRYLYPQPASTALVERLKERGQAFANQVRLITHLLHGQAYSTTVAELNAFDAALSASTSREGESQ